MSKKLMIGIVCMFLLCLSHTAKARPMKPGEFLVLCYHAIPVKPAPGDKYSVSQKDFAEQMEYLRTHGYTPVSFSDILAARDGKKPLPEKAVLLTFDDAYISYYEFVLPFLEELGYPSVLAVIGNFINYPPDTLPEPLMSWEQIREVSSKRLVAVVSHTYDLHRSVQYTPQGNVSAAAGVLAFDGNTNSYETEAEYRMRIDADFREQEKIFKEKLGFVPGVIVWPYGVYNDVSLDVALKNRFPYTFTLEPGYAHVDSLDRTNRTIIENNRIDYFIETLEKPEGEKEHLRAVQVDLDLVVEPDSPEATDENMGRLIDRLVEMKVNTVFLQAFADPEGSGNISSVYFQNSVLPVRADVFGWAAHQIGIRGMKVYGWLPSMSIVLPDEALNSRLRVHELRNGESLPSTSWYKRLSPFSEETGRLVGSLYEDLASHSLIKGILFQDDAYLTDYEDFHPAAMERYAEHFGDSEIKKAAGENSEMAEKWARFKTEALIEYTQKLKKSVTKYRPNALFARNLYAKVVEEPDSELWFAQNYELFLRNYDHVVVMAYPRMEGVKNPAKWLKELAGRAKDVPQGLEKTVFKLQAYDWRKEEWIDDGELLEEMKDILSEGGRHLAYYPDSYHDDKPALEKVKLEMSTKTYPFIP